MFKVKKIDNKSVIYSDLIPELEHFFTTRESVIRSNESNVDIVSNYKSIVDYLNISEKDFISPQQTHSSNVKILSDSVDLTDTDGIILNDFKHAVYLNFADCVPIILYDKEKNIASVVHGGWRGTVKNIVINALNIMTSQLGCKKNNIYSIIGPAISKCCFSVGEDVSEQIVRSVNNADDLIIKKEGLIFADLKLTNYRQLSEFGIPDKNIEICPYCTVCNNDMFFSYRKEHGTTSRHSAVIKLRA